MTLLRVVLYLTLLALAVAVITALILPFTGCEVGFVVREGSVPYCGTPPTPPA